MKKRLLSLLIAVLVIALFVPAVVLADGHKKEEKKDRHERHERYEHHKHHERKHKKTGTVKGYIYYDINRNGRLDPYEIKYYRRMFHWWVPNYVILSKPDGEKPVVTRVNRYNGAYSFSNVKPGKYIVTARINPHFRLVTPNPVKVKLKPNKVANVNFGYGYGYGPGNPVHTLR